MTEENAVVQELDKTGTQVDPNATAAAGTEKVGEEADPQGTQKQGENEQEKKRAGGWQRRQWKAEQERDYWREVALKNAPKPEAEKKAEPVKMPVWADYEAQGKQEQYFPDVAKAVAAEQLKAFKDEQKAEAEKAKTQTEQEKQAAKWEKDSIELRATHPDLDEVIASGNPSPLLKSLVERNKDAVSLAYHLANNPELEAQLSRMTDAVDVAQELGLIRAQLAKPPVEAEETPEPPISKAPKPITPVSKSSPAKSEDIHDPKLPWKRFVALREAELAKRK